MRKSDLKKKINCVKWSAVIFAIGYFLLGAYLTSTGTKFDGKKAYDLLTTSLTLTAYFLAPVAAFVLFSDWRMQHKLIKNEKASLEILKILNNDLFEFYNLNPQYKSDFDSFNEHQIAFHRNIATIFIKIDEIDIIDSPSKEFKAAILSLGTDLEGLHETLLKQMQIVFEHDAIKDYMDTDSSKKKTELINNLKDYSNRNDKFYESICAVIDKLKPLSV